VARTVIDAAFEVHRLLGPGFVESVYDEAMAVELAIRGIDFLRQPRIAVRYKGVAIGRARLDFLVADCLVVELKASEHMLALHQAQLLSYLKTTGHLLGLIINFNVPLLRQGIKRVIRRR
jgi:GxxExxY protein